MSGHVSFQTSDNCCQTPPIGAGRSTHDGTSAGEQQAQFMRLAAELRKKSAPIPPAFADPDIDRLLFAIAEAGGDLRLTEGTQSGHLTVALDTITRWIGKAEERFKHLSEATARNQRLLSNIAVLSNTQGETMLNQIGKTHHIACSTARNLTKITQAILQLNTTAEIRSAVLRQKISSVQKAISLFEDKLTNLEIRVKEEISKGRAQHITDLCYQLDAHSRVAAQRAASSMQFFELVTQKIERLGEELRAQKQAQAIEAETKHNLAHLLEKLGHSISTPPTKIEISSGEPEDIVVPSSVLSPEPPPPLKVGANKRDDLSTFVSPKTNEVDNGNREIRSRFIAAARLAARHGQSGQDEMATLNSGALSDAGKRFLRRNS